jgi:hypothetical protein
LSRITSFSSLTKSLAIWFSFFRSKKEKYYWNREVGNIRDKRRASPAPLLALFIKNKDTVRDNRQASLALLLALLVFC